MHDSVREFVTELAMKRPALFQDKHVLEVGSANVNGSIRGLIEPFSASYLGVDIVKGLDVDRICHAEGLLRTFGEFSFDVVISTEMLEHCRYWKYAINNMKCVARKTVILTTRSPGFPYHEHPGDFWRFTPALMEKVFSDFHNTLVLSDPEYPGVFVWAEREREIPDLKTLDAIPIENIDTLPDGTPTWASTY